MAATIHGQSSMAGSSGPENQRSSSAKVAAFEVAEM